MELTDRQWSLFDFVKQMHGDQRRKYGGEPYYTHLMRVANTVSTFDAEPCVIEIALCHDLIEDTSASLAELSSHLINIGYSVEEDTWILAAVDELTDHYTKAKYPELNRRERKKREAKRMIDMGSSAQTVKYADVIDNMESIVSEDPAFARIYLAEIGAYLGQMDRGNYELHRRCLAVYEASRQALREAVIRH